MIKHIRLYLKLVAAKRKRNKARAALTDYERMTRFSILDTEEQRAFMKLSDASARENSNYERIRKSLKKLS